MASPPQALHSKGFVYRDMKPPNVLVKRDGYVCLVDFGLAARASDAGLKGKCGTRGYWAPEMLKGEGYSYSVDWWSLGVTVRNSRKRRMGRGGGEGGGRGRQA